MKTEKMYYAENLHHSKELKQLLLDNEWFIKSHNTNIKSYNGKSEKTYWVLEQTQWDNEVSMYLSICDGLHHQHDLVKSIDVSDACIQKTIMSLETVYVEDNKGNKYMEMEVKKVRVVDNIDIKDVKFNIAVQQTDEVLITKN